ncbi:hypothetical protein IWW38_005055, partial [Coemansia aciculifera]
MSGQLQLLQLIRVTATTTTSQGTVGATTTPPIPGLNFVYPACPNCGCKISEVSWACLNCGSQVGSSDRAVWTFRVRVGFIDPKKKGRSSYNEMPASILGSTAEAWFGCTAAQWVEETRLAFEHFRGHQHEAQWIERMTEQIMCLVSMGACGGAVGQYRKVALRRDAAPKARHGGKPQYVVSRLIASKDDDDNNFPAVTIVDMWRQVVSEALCAAGTSKDNLEWNIATQLAAGACMEAAAAVVLEHTEDGTFYFAAADLGLNAVLPAWDTEPALQPMFFHAPASPSRTPTGVVDFDDMDALFDHCSGLFTSLPPPPLSALGPEDLILSWQHLEESYDDDSRYSQLANSLADDENGNDGEWAATPGTGSAVGRSRRDYALYNPTPPDTFMRRLEATPESVAREIRGDAAREESQSRRMLDLDPVLPRVLAPATPVGRPVLRLASAVAVGGKTFVPETPVHFLRTHSLDSSAVDCVPETPLHAVTASRHRPPPLLLPPIPPQLTA